MVYGDFLIHFSELFVEVDYYKDTANTGAGFTREYLGKVNIILQPDNGEQLLGPSGRLAGRSNWRVADSSDTECVWVEENSPLEIGHTIQHPDNHMFYKVIEYSSWGFYAGFKAFKAQKIQGNNCNSDDSMDISQGVF
jgi:hypothetical protein